MKTKLILVEGLPGSGKSTTAESISSRLTEMGVIHRCYFENPDKNPMKFLLPSTPTFREDLVGQWLKFTEDMKDCKDLVVLESVYWQWTTWFMIAWNFAHDDVIGINSLLNDIIAPLAPLLVYFSQTDVESHITWTHNLRGEDWSNLMIQRDLQFPYHQSRGHKDLEGLVKCFIEVQSHYDELFDLMQFQKLKVHDPQKDWPGANQRIAEFIRDGL
jgi:hypothetical protein